MIANANPTKTTMSSSARNTYTIPNHIADDSWPAVVKTMWIDKQVQVLLSNKSKHEFKQSINRIRRQFVEMFEPNQAVLDIGQPFSSHSSTGSECLVSPAEPASDSSAAISAPT